MFDSITIEKTDKLPEIPDGPDALTLTIPSVGRFLIQQGNCILYRPDPDVTEDELLLFLNGSCLGALLQQRGYLVLHGNAVSWDNETCLIFLGRQKAGKSTLAARQCLQGAALVADDICPVVFNENNEPVVLPCKSYLKLWQSSLDLLGLSNTGLKKIRPQTEKYIFPVTKTVQTPCRIQQIFELDPTTPVLKRLSGIEKMITLQQQGYRPHFLSRMNIEKAYLNQLMQLAPAVEVMRGHRDPVASACIDNIA